MQLIISDRQGNILANLGEPLLDGKSLEEQLRNDTDNAGLTYMISREAVEGQELQIMLIHKDEKLAFWNQAEFWLLFILIPLTAFAVFVECIQICKTDYLPADRSFRTPPDGNEKGRDV